MEQTYHVKGLKAAILAMSFLQMATNAIASVLADIAAAFPEASATTVQYLMTFPNLLVVVMSVAAAKLAGRVAKRTLAASGLLLGIAAGIGSWLLHGNLILLFVWAGFLGLGIGLVVPMATSLISDYFAGEEKDAMLGYQTAAANVGSMLMTFLGGIVAAWGWYYNYLVYLLAVPGLVLTILFVPGKNVAAQRKTSARIPAGAVPYFVAAAVFMLLFYLGPTNLAMLVEERQLGTAMTAGTAATILLLGGTLMGLLFGRVAAVIGRNTIPLGFAVMALGYFMIFLSAHPLLLYAGSFLVGSSNTLVLPQCMGSVVTDDKEQSTFLMSVVFAVANLGTFFAPAQTALAAAVMRDTSAASRFCFAGMASMCLALVLFACRKRVSATSE